MGTALAIEKELNAMKTWDFLPIGDSPAVMATAPAVDAWNKAQSGFFRKKPAVMQTTQVRCGLSEKSVFSRSVGDKAVIAVRGQGEGEWRLIEDGGMFVLLEPFVSIKQMFQYRERVRMPYDQTPVLVGSLDQLDTTGWRTMVDIARAYHGFRGMLAMGEVIGENKGRMLPCGIYTQFQ